MIRITSMSEKLKNPNVYFDLSAPQLHSQLTLEGAIHKIGYKKLVLGSDSPYGIDNIERTLKRLRKLLLTENLIRILHL